MEIVNGIAYEDGKPIILHIIEIVPLNDYKLRVTFQNGETKIYDFKPLLDKPAFKPLLDQAKFKRVKLSHGVPTWDEENVDISPETIYLQAS